MAAAHANFVKLPGPVGKHYFANNRYAFHLFFTVTWTQEFSVLPEIRFRGIYETCTSWDLATKPALQTSWRRNVGSLFLRPLPMPSLSGCSALKLRQLHQLVRTKRYLPRRLLEHP